MSIEGYIAPRDPFEVKLQPKKYDGPFKTTQVAAHASSVKAGTPLIGFDPTEIDDAILTAASDVEVAKAGLAKAEADVALGDRADAAGLEQKTDAVADAQAQLDWWKKQDGPAFLKQLDLQVQAGQDGIDDQTEELDQLHKMYASESLTNATADIVVKRATRQLERSKQAFVIQKGQTDKQKATDYDNKRQDVERGLALAKQSLDEFNATTAQSKTQRGAALLSARVGLRAAQRKLSDLEVDKAAMTVAAPSDGVVFFGSFVDGAWQGAKPDAIEVGQKQDAGKVVLTLVQPGHIKAIGKASDEQISKLKVGEVTHVKIAAVGDRSLDGKISSLALLPSADGNYTVEIELPASGVERLLPGMKAKIEVMP